MEFLLRCTKCIIQMAVGARPWSHRKRRAHRKPNSIWNSQRTTVVVMSWCDAMVDLYGLYIAVVFLWRFIIRPRVVPLLFGTSYSLIAWCVTHITRALFPRCLFTVTINGLSERGNTQSSDSVLCEAKKICGTTSPWVTVLALFYESVNRLITESKKKN